MMNGSTSGRVSENSSALVTCIGEIEKMQHVAAAVNQPAALQVPQLGNHSVVRMKHELVQQALGPRSLARGVFVERQLEGRVQLYRLTAGQRVRQYRATGADGPGAAQPRERSLAGLAGRKGKRAQDPQ